MHRLIERALCFVAALICSVESQAADNPLATVAPGRPVAIPFDLKRGHVMVPATVLGTNKISMLLDTGYGMTMLHPGRAEAFALKPTGRSLTIVGIAGEEKAALFEGPAFDFAGLAWKPRRVAALPADNSSRSRRRDGILGSGFFRRFVVEIDSRQGILRLHEPEAFTHSGGGETLPLTFKGTTPIVEASVRLADGSDIKARFEIDTGCDGALCLGKHFVGEHRLASSDANANGARVGVGGSTRIKSGHLPAISFGKLSVEKPSANFFLEGSPVDAPLAGHIGWELLRKFKVIFDYSRQRMMLESRN